MERLGHDGKLAHVSRLTVYVCPDGSLVLSTGNVKMSVTPEEASALLDSLLLYAQRFHQATPVSNGHVTLPH